MLQKEHSTGRQGICTFAKVPPLRLPSWGILRKSLPFLGLICKMKGMEKMVLYGYRI